MTVTISHNHQKTPRGLHSRLAFKESKLNFNEIPLKESLLRALEARGYTEPTDIQSEAIPLLIEKNTDFVGQAQTGTGKTAAFSLPLLHLLVQILFPIQFLILLLSFHFELF